MSNKWACLIFVNATMELIYPDIELISLSQWLGQTTVWVFPKLSSIKHESFIHTMSEKVFGEYYHEFSPTQHLDIVMMRIEAQGKLFVKLFLRLMERHDSKSYSQFFYGETNKPAWERKVFLHVRDESSHDPNKISSSLYWFFMPVLPHTHTQALLPIGSFFPVHRPVLTNPFDMASITIKDCLSSQLI